MQLFWAFMYATRFVDYCDLCLCVGGVVFTKRCFLAFFYARWYCTKSMKLECEKCAVCFYLTISKCKLYNACMRKCGILFIVFRYKRLVELRCLEYRSSVLYWQPPHKYTTTSLIRFACLFFCWPLSDCDHCV